MLHQNFKDFIEFAGEISSIATLSIRFSIQEIFDIKPNVIVVYSKLHARLDFTLNKRDRGIDRYI